MKPTRRSFCEWLGASLLLQHVAGCAQAPTAKPPAPPLGTVTWQVGWVKNVEYAGSYIAQSRGYYRAQGIAVDILPGGPNVAVEPLLVAGKALVGQSTVGMIADARAGGAPLKIIAAWPKNPEVFISLANKPIRTPRELVGKRLGVPSDNLVDAKGFLTSNGIALDAVRFVPVQFDPGPLVAGECDAYMGFSTNEAITLAVRGVATELLRIDEFGYSGILMVYAAHEASLADPIRRAQLKAFLRGERLGWRDALRDPDLGVQLTLRTYGSDLGLNPKQQALQSRATNALLAASETPAHGLFWMSPASIARAMAVLRVEGIAARASDLFDTTLLAEIDANR